jgi:AcrR family transcriptional regulator
MTPPPALPAALAQGLRERKKAETRRAISDAATRLFMELGFHEVTLAEVGEAAGVSIKTIFNYFGSKEELFFDREAELRDAIVGAVTGRAPGRTITEALAAQLSEHRLPVAGDGWSVLRDPRRYEQFRRFLATWQGSGALRGRALVGNERLQDELAEAVAVSARLAPDDDRVRAMAAMLACAVQLRHRTLAGALLEGAPAEEVERRVRAVVAEALVRVATAFPDLDTPA